MSTDPTKIKQVVQERYGALARQRNEADEIPLQVKSNCCSPTGSSCCDSTDSSLAETLYAQVDLVDLPDSVTGISLGCGNPTAITGLKPGETVLDLGSGGGIDCFIAAKAIGSTGRVIGVDMTDDMLALANRNKARLGVTNVEFRQGEIEALPVENDTVDVIISNCVINLSPDKEAVFREAFRVLKPGGRFTVSDIVTAGEIPESLRANIEAWAGCVSGAIDQNLYLEKLRQAGFINVTVQSRTAYTLDPLDEAASEALLDGVDVAAIPADARVYSANIIAYKPE